MKIDLGRNQKAIFQSMYMVNTFTYVEIYFLFIFAQYLYNATYLFYTLTFNFYITVHVV